MSRTIMIVAGICFVSTFVLHAGENQKLLAQRTTVKITNDPTKNFAMNSSSSEEQKRLIEEVENDDEFAESCSFLSTKTLKCIGAASGVGGACLVITAPILVMVGLCMDPSTCFILSMTGLGETVCGAVSLGTSVGACNEAYDREKNIKIKNPRHVTLTLLQQTMMENG